MRPEIEKLADLLQMQLSPKELDELAHDLEIRAKDEYYKQHPEETKNA